MMAIFHKRAALAGAALLVLGASVVALTGDLSSRDERPVRPPAVYPATEAPTAAELERHERAHRQPTGRLEPGHELVTPRVADPQR